MDELFIELRGFEANYLVSDLGNIYSKRNDRVLKANDSGKGYLKLSLCKANQVFTRFVHRCVIESFLGSSHLHVNHINSNRQDNRLCNLEYVTKRQNQHLRKLNKALPVGVTNHSNGTFRSRIEIDGKVISLGTFKTIELASKAFNDKLKEVENGL